MKYGAVIFDLDGTLLNTLQDIADAVNYVLTNYGFPQYEMDQYKYFVGDGITTLAERVIPSDVQREPLIHSFVAALREEYSKRWDHKTQRYPGIAELLDALTVTR